METLKSNYLRMIKVINISVKFANEALTMLEEMKVKMDKITFELKLTNNSLERTQIVLLEVEGKLHVAKHFKDQEDEARAKEIMQ